MNNKNKNEELYKVKFHKYKPVYRRGISKFEYRVLWTAIWLLFIGGLCVLFNSGLPLWLLLVWILGIAE